MVRILVVDDEEKMRHLLSIMLGRRGHRVDQAGDGVEALEMIRNVHYDMVITDVKMPRMDGEALLKKIVEMDNSCPVVFITAFATVESAVDAMRAGAVDYITKPFEEERILLTVERTLNLSRIMAENRDLKRELQQTTGSEEIVYGSEKMSEVMNLSARVAEGDTAVLITGESGTGKELLAKYIHRASLRRDKRFVPVNCAAISPNLVEAELFGHEKGAFTGAIRKNQGKFEYANGGTLFLDEIGDLSLEAQAKLRRALQEKKIQRVGGNEEIRVDVRVICATNQDIREIVNRGAFRQDLYFRINVFPLEPPPLRERTDDVILLAKHFLGCMAAGQDITLTDGAAKLLSGYTWPGNVRELANVIERAVILAGKTGCITVDTLSFLRSALSFGTECSDFQLPPQGILLEEVEGDFVRQALAMTNNNQTASAKLLGLTRAKFRILMKQL
ncbi:MAG: sigma-54-dependent Fis family transcriptional regulator [Syntrophobacterales bacterium]|nr:MAG: sigma-54-dependent Fis family transcriptional regulator [Syntrophobacterales bacterium]